MKHGWFPDPSEYPSSRLFSLDWLRGADMFFLVVLSAVVKAGGKSWPLPEFLAGQLYHPKWAGLSAFDLVMPLFIFMCGAAVPLALRRLLREGRPTAAFWRHVAWRVVMLWTLGMVCQGALLFWDHMKFHPYCNTLQAIAAGYVIAAAVMLSPRPGLRLVLPFAIIAVYGAAMHLYGSYEPDSNLAEVVERRFYEMFLPLFPAGSAVQEAVKTSHTTWILPTPVFGAITLFGMNSTLVLTGPGSQWRKAAILSGAGALMIAVACALFPAVPCVKRIWTASFTLWACGWCMLMFAAAYVLTDIWRLRKGTGLILLYGQFALWAYMGGTYFKSVLISVFRSLTPEVVGHFGFEKYEPVITAAGMAVVLTAVLVVRRRLGTAADGTRPAQI